MPQRRVRSAKATADRHPVTAAVREGAIQLSVQDSRSPHLVAQLGPGQELVAGIAVIDAAKAQLVTVREPLQYRRPPRHD